MKKLLAILLIVTSCSRTVSVPVSRVGILNQQSGFILGLQALHFTIERVTLDEKKKAYSVSGWVEEIRKYGSGNPAEKLKMELISGEDTSFLGYTNPGGSFQVIIKPAQIIKFSGEAQDKYIFIKD